MMLNYGLLRKDKELKEKMFWQTKNLEWVKENAIQEEIYLQIQGDYHDKVLRINTLSLR